MRRDCEELVLVSICFIFTVSIFLMLPQFTFHISFVPVISEMRQAVSMFPLLQVKKSEKSIPTHTASKRKRYMVLALRLSLYSGPCSRKL